MGFFSWLQNVFGGKPARTRERQAVASCLYCGAAVISTQSRECQACGRRWDGTSSDNEQPPHRPQPPSLPEQARAANSQSHVTRDQLEAGDFTPLTQEEEQEGLTAGSGALPWGRRDRIPSAKDPRIRFVDRAMVARGLITPERLAEIHRVGEEMDEVAPDNSVFARRANEAVQSDREQRAERKRQKKAEAQARRDQRQKEIAERKATEIVFLGRGVSRQLGKQTARVKELKQRNLPILQTAADVANALGLSIGELRWLAFHNICATRIHYVLFEVAKRSGGMRQLAAPHRKLAKCQKWIEAEILQKLDVHDAANGFVCGKSIVTNATPHVGQDVIVNLDLQDFFPTITFPRVQGLFRKLGYSPAAATILALLSTECPRQEIEFAGVKYFVAVGERSLPQGACTSPALSNLIAYNLDCRLSGLAQKHGWTYTRYADDLSFSRKADASHAGLISVVRQIAEDEGFQLNEQKSRVLRNSARQCVTGVVVNVHPNAPRKLIRRLRAILHRAKTKGLAAQNREAMPNFPAWLQGQISYVTMLNPAQGKKLQAEFRRLPDHADS